jgi:4-amino-4-deoxy-L-arabinose transferase-like glycosyltransferase
MTAVDVRTARAEVARPAAPYGPPSSAAFRRRVAVVAAVAFGLRVLYVVFEKRDDPAQGDGIYYSAQAMEIARGHWFTRPFTGGAAADHPPLTALLMAPSDWVASGSVLAQRLLMCAAGAVVVVLVAVLTRRLAGERAGVIAAVVAAGYANFWMNDGLPMSETFSAVLICLALLAIYRYADDPTPARAAVAGGTVGMAVLVRAELALMAPLVVIPLALLAARDGHRLPGRQRIGQLVVALATMVAVNLPWFAYNQARFHDFVLVSTNEGLTYRGANCDGTYYGGGTGFWALHCAETDPPPAGSDESQQSTWWRDHAFTYARQNLSRLPTVAVVRVLRTWSLWDQRQMAWLNQGEGREIWASNVGVVSFWLLAPLALAGGLLLRLRGVLLLPLLALPIIVTIVSLWFYGIVRFRLPAEITVVVLAAPALEALFTMLLMTSPPSSTAGRAIAT